MRLVGFLEKYYPNFNIEDLSKEQKIEVVETTVTQNKRLSSHEIEKVILDLEEKQIEKDLYVLLNNRPPFVLSIQKKTCRKAIREFAFEKWGKYF